MGISFCCLVPQRDFSAARGFQDSQEFSIFFFAFDVLTYFNVIGRSLSDRPLFIFLLAGGASPFQPESVRMT